MATFLGPSTFLSHPISRTNYIFSSTQPPNQPQPSQPQSPPPQQLNRTAADAETPSATTAKVQEQKRSRPVGTKSVESTDWIVSSLTRRFGLGAGLAWAGFLAIGVLSEQIKTRFEVSQEAANTRYYDQRVGGGASPRTGDLVVINVKGKVQGADEAFLDTFGGKKPLALVMGSRPYNRGICDGLGSGFGGKRKVIIPPNLCFGEEGADLGSGLQVPPSATVEYIIEVEKVSIAPA